MGAKKLQNGLKQEIYMAAVVNGPSSLALWAAIFGLTAVKWAIVSTNLQIANKTLSIKQIPSLIPDSFIY